MLVVTRKTSERIKIGDTVVTLVRAENGRARIGIDAPRDVKIVREELVDGGFGPKSDAPRKRGSRKSSPDGVGVCES